MDDDDGEKRVDSDECELFNEGWCQARRRSCDWTLSAAGPSREEVALFNFNFHRGLTLTHSHSHPFGGRWRDTSIIWSSSLIFSAMFLQLTVLSVILAGAAFGCGMLPLTVSFSSKSLFHASHPANLSHPFIREPHRTPIGSGHRASLRRWPGCYHS